MDQYGIIAQAALVACVPFSLAFFFLFRPQKAALLTIIGGDMFLPERVGFKFPFLPVLDKSNIPYLCVLLGCLLRCPGRVTKPPKERWFTMLTLVLIVGATVTGALNSDPVIWKWHVPIPGTTVKDGLFMAFSNVCRISLPFYLGSVLFRTVDDFRKLLIGFSVAGIIYAPFCLFEVRFSPQLHVWIYGYLQSNFDQTMRWGGFRPMVFMPHGLALARFLVVTILATFAIRSFKKTLFGIPTGLVAWGLFVVLLLCKSTGAIFLSTIAIFFSLRTGVKTRFRVALALSSIVLLYPLLRTADLFPIDSIMNVFRFLVGSDRAESLGFRFVNEGRMLDRARLRILFGWGEYGRNFVYDDYWASIPDGYWIIQISMLGMIGFLASFGPAVIPMFLAKRRLKAAAILPADRKLVTSSVVLLSVTVLDWIPNGLWAPYPYMIAGALAGVTRWLTDNPVPVPARAQPPGQY